MPERLSTCRSLSNAASFSASFVASPGRVRLHVVGPNRAHPQPGAEDLL
jgi:hypothetical protein